MSWYCYKCKQWFEKPIEKEWIDEIYGPYRRVTYQYLCPDCEDETIEQTDDCPICGGHTLPEETFCEDCKGKVKEFVENMAIDNSTNKDVIEELIYECV